MRFLKRGLQFFVRNAKGDEAVRKLQSQESVVAKIKPAYFPKKMPSRSHPLSGTTPRQGTFVSETSGNTAGSARKHMSTNTIKKQVRENFLELPWYKRPESKSDAIDTITRLYAVLITLGGAAYATYKLFYPDTAQRAIDNLSEVALATPHQPRKSLLRELMNEIDALNGLSILNITGPSGTGKSQLALEYARQWSKERENKPYDSKEINTCYWLEATPSLLEHNYRQFAKKLGVDDKVCTTLPEIQSAVNHLLAQRPGFLLIFDNVADNDTIQAYIPSYAAIQDRLPGHREPVLRGKIILISQKKLNSPLREFKVGGLQTEGLNSEALSLLNTIFENKDEQSERQILAKKLGGLPLALRLAAFSIKANKDLTLKEYKKKVDEAIGSTPLSAPLSMEDTTKIYHTVVDITLESLEAYPRAYELLAFCSLLGQKDIPTGILRDYVTKHFQATDPAKELLDNLYALNKLGLVSDNYHLIPHLHQTIQLQALAAWDMFVAKAMKRTPAVHLSTRSDIVNNAIHLFESHLDDNMVFKAEVEKKSFLIPHVSALLTYVKEHQEEMSALYFSVARLSAGLASFHMQSGMAYRANQLLKEGKEALEVGGSEAFLKKSPDELCEFLFSHHPSLPTRYAQTLYLMSRTYFYNQDGAPMPAELEGYLDTAIAMREVIDKNKKYDDTLNKDGYTQIYKRSGKALLLILKAESSHDVCPESLCQAEYLIKKELLPFKTKDDFHQAVCYEYLAKIYLLRAKKACAYQDKQNYFKQAIEYVEGAPDKHIPGALELLKQGTKNYNQKSKFYNAVGNVYLEREEAGDLPLAKQRFNECLQLEGNKKNFPAVDAHYGLARTYYKEHDFALAHHHAKESIDISFAMGRTVKHPDVKSALVLLDLIETVQLERRVVAMP